MLNYVAPLFYHIADSHAIQICLISFSYSAHTKSALSRRLAAFEKAFEMSAEKTNPFESP